MEENRLSDKNRSDKSGRDISGAEINTAGTEMPDTDAAAAGTHETGAAGAETPDTDAAGAGTPDTNAAGAETSEKADAAIKKEEIRKQNRDETEEENREGISERNPDADGADAKVQSRHTDPEETERRKRFFLNGPARIITYVIIIAAVLAAGLTAAAVIRRWKFRGYRVVSSRRQEDTISASYVCVGGNVLRYGTDGASMLDRSGAVMWDVNYSMDEPAVTVRDNMAAIYDRSGSDIVVCSREGQIGTLSSTLPVLRARVSPTGNVAVIEEDNDNAYIEYYSPDGGQIAEIKTSMDNPGYPMDADISDDGQLLAVSYVVYEGGTQKTAIHVYSFGTAGQNQMDNRIGTFEYSGKIMPEIDFLSDSSFAAFSDDGFVVISGARQPEETASVETEGEISSVFHDDTHIGMIVSEDGVSHLKIYTTSGSENTDREFDFAYTDMDFTDGEISLYNGSEFCVFDTSGYNKFTGSYDGSMQRIFALGHYRYAVVRDASIDFIRLS